MDSLKELIVAFMTGGPARGVLIVLATAGLLLGATAAHAAQGTMPSAAPPKDWDDAVVLRIMPVVPASWDAYEDHLQIVRPTGRVTQLPTGGPMSGLDFSYPERTFSVRLVPLEAGDRSHR